MGITLFFVLLPRTEKGRMAVIAAHRESFFDLHTGTNWDQHERRSFNRWVNNSAVSFSMRIIFRRIRMSRFMNSAYLQVMFFSRIARLLIWLTSFLVVLRAGRFRF